MTRKHYVAIAAILKASNYSETYSEQVAYKSHCEDFADYFATDNGNFDRARFLEACGVTN